MIPNKNILKRLRDDGAASPHSERKPLRKQAGLPLQRMDRHLVGILATDSYEAEQYRKLRYVIEEKRVPGRGLVTGICSAAAGDGKSLTALNLAGTLAQDTSARVLLVDTDLRRQSDTLKSCLGIKDKDIRGLTDLLVSSGLSLEDISLQVNATGNLDVVLTGEQSIAPYEALRSARFTEFMADARRDYDYVIVDAPPVVPVSDCRVISRHVDGFLIVVSAHRTPRTMLEEALDLMDPEKAMGLVFNRSDLMPYRYYGYYGYARPSRKSSGRLPPLREPRGGTPPVRTR